MKILVIDDLRTFDPAPKGALVQYARNSADGICALESLADNQTQVDELWLDHDLGIYDTIRPCVLWLVEKAYAGYVYAAKVYVHTGNPSNRDSMVRQLTTAGYETEGVVASQWNLLGGF